MSFPMIKFALLPTRTLDGWVWLRFYKRYGSRKFKMLATRRYNKGERVETRMKGN